MAWKYQISTGTLTAANGSFAGTGYSGEEGEWRNNPKAESDVALGPIPQGMWGIGAPHPDTQTGPYTMDLNSLPGTNTYGRSLFRIHGDNITHNASHGCIILGPAIRQSIWTSGDHILEVVP